MATLLADAQMMVFWIGTIVVPLLIVVHAYRQGFQSAEAMTKRLGNEHRGDNFVPLARTCPMCGSADYKKGPALEEHFLFNFDRVCNRCGTFYTYPFPTWLAIAVIVFGVVLIFTGIGAAVYAHFKFPNDQMMLCAPVGVGFSLGSLCIYGGIVKLKAARNLPN